MTPDRVLAEVRAEMARQGLTQTQLADRLADLSQTGLSRRLAGKSEISLMELIEVCDALGVTLADLATRAERVAA